jgi:serine/threonine protein kinase/tetratricopeptide (TPR) repeat protein
MPADPKRVETLFNRTLALPPEDQAAFLAVECGGDAELRGRVERLLAAHAELGEPATADQPPDPATAPLGDSPATEDHTPAADTGTLIAGKYKLIEEVGEGGMGTVWMAQQTEPVKRFVAVKLIKAGMDSKAVLARFDAERQALALMDHPNIAKVLDADATPDGHPFFVMELVKGIPITKFCDERKLTPRERLELFVPVCQAIQHAHQKGVIHRDIKPSNVLVALYDDQPVPKVIDFGVAKAAGQPLTDKTLATGFGAVVGTPEYMSPEQASFNNLDIDTRSDVYALGVLLYELLAGSPPFSRKELEKIGLLEIFRVIREQEPPRPSTKLSTADALPTLSANRGTEPKRLAALLRGELDWIVMKSLEKDRNRRYETANGFAADVQRYLAGEPVQAVPPSTGYRLKKFLRRNKGPVMAAALVFGVLLAGVAGTTWGMIRAEHARDGESRQREIAEGKERDAIAAAKEERLAKEREAQQRSIAEGRRVEAEKQTKRAEEQTAVAQENERQALEQFRMAEAVRTFLHLRLLAQGGVRAQMAAWRLAGGGFEIKPNPTVGELLDRAARELTPNAIEKNFPGQPHVQAAILLAMGDTYRDIGDNQRAEHYLTRAHKIFHDIFGPDGDWTFVSLNSLGEVYLADGKAQQALKLFEQLRDSAAKLAQSGDGRVKVQNNLASAYLLVGQPIEAIKLFEALRKESITKEGAEASEVLTVTSNLAAAYDQAGRQTEAIELLEQVRAVRVKKLGDTHPETLETLHNLAAAYTRAGKPTKAIAILEPVRDTLRDKFGPDDPLTLYALVTLAAAYNLADKPALAITLLEQLRDDLVKKLGPNHQLVRIALQHLASSYLAAKKLPQAFALLEQLRETQLKTVGPDHPEALETLTSLAHAYFQAGNYAKSAELTEELRARQTKRYTADHLRTISTTKTLAALYDRLGKFPAAVELYEEVRAFEAKTHGKDHSETLITTALLGGVYRKSGEWQKAIPLLREAAEAAEKGKFQNPDSSWIVGFLCTCYEQLERFADAESWRRKWLAVVKQRSGTGSPAYAQILTALGSNLRRQQKWADAEPIQREILALWEKNEPDAVPTFAAKSALGEILLKQKKHADAEPLVLEGYEGLKERAATVPPAAKQVFAEVLSGAADRLVELYTAWGKPEQAAKWRAERAKYPFVAPMPREVKR